MKSLSTRSKVSNNHQVESQKSTVLHDNKKTEWITSMMSRNLDRIWLCNITLQRKRQQLDRHLKQKIRLHEERNQIREASNAMNKQRRTVEIHTLLNYLNWRISEWTNQKRNLKRQIYTKDNQENRETFWNESHKETTIVSRTDLHVICNKKKSNLTTS